MNKFPRISFGMIVFNGEPFVRYNLRALYPYAHEIIVVEGAAPGSSAIATPDGHSTDGTLQTLYDFKEQEDPENKVILIIKDGVWEGEKHEMSQAYANKATGDYLWQVDSDEFYMPEDIQVVGNMLNENPNITAVSFKMITFWGSINYSVDSWYLLRGANIYHRLFKWGAGYKYLTHRPPTVEDARGVDLRNVSWIRGEDMAKKGIMLYHYSLLFPKQVKDKSAYYSYAVGKGTSASPEWVQESYLSLKKPFRVHNVFKYPGWLEHYRGDHPPQALKMWQDVTSGILDIEVRPVNDVEKLLSSLWYPIGRIYLKVGFWIYQTWKKHIRPRVLYVVNKTWLGWPIRKLRNLAALLGLNAAKVD